MEQRIKLCICIRMSVKKSVKMIFDDQTASERAVFLVYVRLPLLNNESEVVEGLITPCNRPHSVPHKVPFMCSSCSSSIFFFICVFVTG